MEDSSTNEHIYERISKYYDLPVDRISVVHERGRGIAWRIWPSAHVLIDWLEDNTQKWCKQKVHCVEIGAGVGMVGIASVALGSDLTTITDLPEELFAIERSVYANDRVVQDRIIVKPLHFGSADDIASVLSDTPPKCKRVVLASDIIYFESLFVPIAETLRIFAHNYNAVAYIGYKKRNWKTEKRFFTKVLAQHQLEFSVVFEGLTEEEDASSQSTSGSVNYQDSTADSTTAEEPLWNTRVFKIFAATSTSTRQPKFTK